MNRRRFFLSLFGAALLPLAVHGRARQSEPRLAIQESALAGFQYHEGERLWPRLHPGQVLTLLREPENRHDRRAVRLDWYGRKLGYLPRSENAAVSQMLDRGVPLRARIARLHDSRDPSARVRVAVELSTDKE